MSTQYNDESGPPAKLNLANFLHGAN